MESNKVDILNLKSVKNYALKEGVTSSYIYKLIKEKKLKSIDIDGVKFIDPKWSRSLKNIK